MNQNLRIRIRESVPESTTDSGETSLNLGTADRMLIHESMNACQKAWICAGIHDWWGILKCLQSQFISWEPVAVPMRRLTLCRADRRVTDWQLRWTRPTSRLGSKRAASLNWWNESGTSCRSSRSGTEASRRKTRPEWPTATWLGTKRSGLPLSPTSLWIFLGADRRVRNSMNPGICPTIRKCVPESVNHAGESSLDLRTLDSIFIHESMNLVRIREYGPESVNRNPRIWPISQNRNPWIWPISVNRNPWIWAWIREWLWRWKCWCTQFSSCEPVGANILFFSLPLIPVGTEALLHQTTGPCWISIRDRCGCSSKSSKSVAVCRSWSGPLSCACSFLNQLQTTMQYAANGHVTCICWRRGCFPASPLRISSPLCCPFWNRETELTRACYFLNRPTRREEKNSKKRKKSQIIP